MIDPSIAKSKWKMAIVNQVFPDSLGYVRSAEVKATSGLYKRPITKLTLLLSKDEINLSEVNSLGGGMEGLHST